MRVRRVMATDFPRVLPEADVSEVAGLLLRSGDGLLVVDHRGLLRGVITEADLLFRGADPALPDGGSPWASSFWQDGLLESGGRSAEEIMTVRPVTIGPDFELLLALRRMLETRVKLLPVVEAGRAVGLLLRRDLLRLYLSQPRLFRG